MTTPTRPTPRQRLLDAAADLFYRQGIGAVGVDLVSKQAGVSKRTLYQQFGSKDRLIAESLAAHGAAIIGHYIPAEDPGAPARQQILAVFDGLSGWTASETFRGCPFVNTATELADPGHPARQIARDHKLALRGYFARHAERGQANDPQRLADQLTIVFDGAIVQAVMGTLRHSDAPAARPRRCSTHTASPSTRPTPTTARRSRTSTCNAGERPASSAGPAVAPHSGSTY